MSLRSSIYNKYHMLHRQENSATCRQNIFVFRTILKINRYLFSLHCIKRLVFVAETCGVSCEVRTGILNVILLRLCLKGYWGSSHQDSFFCLMLSIAPHLSNNIKYYIINDYEACKYMIN